MLLRLFYLISFSIFKFNIPAVSFGIEFEKNIVFLVFRIKFEEKRHRNSGFKGTSSGVKFSFDFSWHDANLPLLTE